MSKELRITRAGCLAVHLMPEYHGRKLSNAVKRIMASGPRDKYERAAVAKANADDLGLEPKIPLGRTT